MSKISELVERDTVPGADDPPAADDQTQDHTTDESPDLHGEPAPADEPTGNEDDEPAAEPTAEPAADEPPPPPSEDAVEQLGAELERHWESVKAIMGADLEAFTFCPTCVKYQTPLPGMVPASVVDLEPVLNHMPDTVMCETCDGWGWLETGSRKVGAETLPCIGCGGTGYTTKISTAAPAPALTLAPQPVPGEDPRVAALRAEGYVVVPTTAPPSPSAA